MGSSEELDSFIDRVDHISNIIHDMHSESDAVCNLAMQKADLVLQGRDIAGEVEDIERACQVTAENRKCINPKPYASAETAQQEMFKREIERDARARAEQRKEREREAEKLKLLAISAFREKQFRDALFYYSEALKKVKDSALLWTSRAQVHIELEQPMAALSDLDWALRLNETSLRALIHQGRAQALLGNQQLARASYDKALLHHPDQKLTIDKYIAQLEMES